MQDLGFPVMMHEISEAFFLGSADIVGGEMGEAMRRIVENPADQQALAVLAEEPGYNSRLRTTCVATLLSGGHAGNALPQLAEATVNCRIFPTHDPEDVQASLQEIAAPFDVEVVAQGQARPSPPYR